MRGVVLSVIFVLCGAPALAGAPAAAPPASALCLNPDKNYDADWIAGRAVSIKATAGKRPRASYRAETNCIGIDGRARITIEAKQTCLAAGDAVKLRRPGDAGVQTCAIVKLDPAP